MKDIELWHGDCIEVMQTLIEKGVKVDLTVTSPPYDNLRTYNGTCDWSFDIFKQVAQCLYGITKEGGVVVWIVGDATIKGSETGTSFKQALYFKEIGFNLHDTMIYAKKILYHKIIIDMNKLLNICLSFLRENQNLLILFLNIQKTMERFLIGVGEKL